MAKYLNLVKEIKALQVAETEAITAVEKKNKAFSLHEKLQELRIEWYRGCLRRNCERLL